MHDKSVYEVNYPDVTAEQLTDNIIAEMTEVTGHKINYSDITKLGGFINSSNGNL